MIFAIKLFIDDAEQEEGSQERRVRILFILNNKETYQYSHDVFEFGYPWCLI